ncbi:MAG: hypothetical protein V7711_01935 [Pseudomonadales bacterium]
MYDDDEEVWPEADDDSTPAQTVICQFDSLEQTRAQLGQLLDELQLAFAEPDPRYGLSGVPFVKDNIGAEWRIDNELDCRLALFPIIKGEPCYELAEGLDDALLIMVRDGMGTASHTAVKMLLELLVEDISGLISAIDWSELETLFAEGERGLGVYNIDGIELMTIDSQGREYGSC